MSTVYKKLWGILLFFVCFSPLFGDSTPLFWKATKGERTFYLLGTIHVGSDELYPMPDIVYESLKESQTLFVEVDIRDLDKEAFGTTIESVSSMPDDSLFDLLDSDTWFALDDVLDDYQMKLVNMEHMQPWYFVYLLSGLPASRGDFDPELGVDIYIMDLADKDDIPVVSLETFEGQLKVFSDWNIQDQIVLLKETLESDEESMDSLKALHDAWRDGDETSLSEQEQSPEEAGTMMKRFWDRIVYERNQRMLSSLLEDTGKMNTAFVAVGTMHMLGDRGLVKLLEAQGYSISLLSGTTEEEVAHD